jgi:hypothetical protein
LAAEGSICHLTGLTFVKTFKRDYVRINSLPDARTALSPIDHWMEESRLGYRSPAREYIASLQQAACPV